MATGVGLRIRQRRTELNLSQEALASRMGLKSKSTICKVERGDDNLTADTIAKYAEALHTSPAFLMGWVQNPDPNYDPKEFDNPYDTEVEYDEITSEALSLYDLYQSASPEVQTAVQILLKSQKSDS